MAGPAALVSVRHLARMGERDFDFELVRGRLVPVSPGGAEHGALTGHLTVRLGAFVEARNLGRVYAAETGYVLARNPDVVRAPDVSLIRRERLPRGRIRPGFVNGPPDFAVEVRSPDQTLAELFAKAREYLVAGAGLVWIVEPRARRVHVLQRGHQRIVRSGSQTLDGGEVVPGFRLRLPDLFGVLKPRP
jgi:Uma2 family endonuclease